MTTEPSSSLIALAAVTGLVHTLAGPDHYLPFVVLARARSWSVAKTTVVTVLCGVGHVLGSVLLGAIGIAVGAAIFRLEMIESARGDLAAWAMIAFGLAYAVWGWRRKVRGKRHEHVHSHADRTVHSHVHSHHSDHAHVHESEALGRSITPWVLFTIFVFGPCEVLIPQLMVPAAAGNVGLLITVVTVFGVTTIGTMLTTVLALTLGLRRFELGWLRRNTHAVAGATITACGVLILIGL